MNKILNFADNYTGFGISAMESTISASILRGRPFAGVCTLVHNKYAAHVKCLMCAERFVVLAIGTTIFINVYVPSNSKENARTIQSMFTEIQEVIYQYPDFMIIMGGDFNTDMSVKSNAAGLVNEFMSAHKLILCTDIIAPNSSYTFYKETQNYSSFIDYFMIS